MKIDYTNDIEFDFLFLNFIEAGFPFAKVVGIQEFITEGCDSLIISRLWVSIPQLFVVRWLLFMSFIKLRYPIFADEALDLLICEQNMC